MSCPRFESVFFWTSVPRQWYLLSKPDYEIPKGIALVLQCSTYMSTQLTNLFPTATTRTKTTCATNALHLIHWFLGPDNLATVKKGFSFSAIYAFEHIHRHVLGSLRFWLNGTCMLENSTHDSNSKIWRHRRTGSRSTGHLTTIRSDDM